MECSRKTSTIFNAQNREIRNVKEYRKALFLTFKNRSFVPLQHQGNKPNQTKANYNRY